MTGPKKVATIVDIVSGLLELGLKNLDNDISPGRQCDALREPGKSKLRDIHTELDDAVFEPFGFTREDNVLAQLPRNTRHRE
jgi:hypothetical protein